jgi:hypothetical protein
MTAGLGVCGNGGTFLLGLVAVFWLFGCHACILYVKKNEEKRWC